MLSDRQFFNQQARARLVLVGLSLLAWTHLSARTTLQLSDSTGTAGTTIQVDLQLNTDDPVTAAQIDLFADPNVADITNISSSDAGAGHIMDMQDLGDGRIRIVVYSSSSELLISEVLLDLEVSLQSNVEENDRSIAVEEVVLATNNAQWVHTELVPNAVLTSAPDSSVEYKMGDEVNASSVAYGTSAELDRVEFLVDGWPAGSDSEPPYSMSFPLHYFGDVTISARAVDKDGNFFVTASEDYVVTFPPTYEDWLDVFFSEAEQGNPDIGGLAADEDLDLISTLAEYAMGLHPRRRDGPRESGFTQNRQTGGFEFSYLRPSDVVNLSYTVQVSDNLDNWVAINPAATQEVVPSGPYLEEVRFSISQLQEPQRFSRVLIEQTAP